MRLLLGSIRQDFGGVIGVVIAVALVASYLPARRAANLDPMNALRAE